MSETTTITGLHAVEILDSRGRPTVQTTCTLAGGAIATVSVPSGASTGAAEAHELRDGDPGRYGGLGVRTAVANVNGEIAAHLAGWDALDQAGIDEALINARRNRAEIPTRGKRDSLCLAGGGPGIGSRDWCAVVRPVRGNCWSGRDAGEAATSDGQSLQRW